MHNADVADQRVAMTQDDLRAARSMRAPGCKQSKQGNGDDRRQMSPTRWQAPGCQPWSYISNSLPRFSFGSESREHARVESHGLPDALHRLRHTLAPTAKSDLQRNG